MLVDNLFQIWKTERLWAEHYVAFCSYNPSDNPVHPSDNPFGRLPEGAKLYVPPIGDMNVFDQYDDPPPCWAFGQGPNLVRDFSRHSYDWSAGMILALTPFALLVFWGIAWRIVRWIALGFRQERS